LSMKASSARTFALRLRTASAGDLAPGLAAGLPGGGAGGQMAECLCYCVATEGTL